LKKIEDSNLASQILDRVNALNTDTVIKAAAFAVPFAVLPQSVSAPLVATSLIILGKSIKRIDHYTSMVFFDISHKINVQPSVILKSSTALYALNGKLPTAK
jgi:hypothetical protein